VSRCLLGEKVRYDGKDQADPWIMSQPSAGTEGEVIQWIGVCPEVEMGMDVPREPVRLEGDSTAPRMRGIESRIDHTCDMHHWAGGKLAELGIDDLDGFVLKSRSPSCGVGDADLFEEDGRDPVGTVDGLFTAALRRAFPFLPVATETQLQNEDGRELFLLRCRLHRLYKEAVALGGDPSRLEELHGNAREALRRSSFFAPRDEGARRERLLEAAFSRLRRAFDEPGQKTRELTAYGQLLHDLLDSAPGIR